MTENDFSSRTEASTESYEDNLLGEAIESVKSSEHWTNSVGAVVFRANEIKYPLDCEKYNTILQPEDLYLEVEDEIAKVIEKYNNRGFSLREIEKDALYNNRIVGALQVGDEKLQEIARIGNISNNKLNNTIIRLLVNKRYLNAQEKNSVVGLESFYQNLISGLVELKKINLGLLEVKILRQRVKETGTDQPQSISEFRTIMNKLNRDYTSKTSIVIDISDLGPEWNYPNRIGYPYLNYWKQYSDEIAPQYMDMQKFNYREDKEEPLHLKRALKFIKESKVQCNELISVLEKKYKGLDPEISVRSDIRLAPLTSNAMREANPNLTRNIIKMLNPDYSDEEVEAERERIFGKSFNPINEKTQVILELEMLANDDAFEMARAELEKIKASLKKFALINGGIAHQIETEEVLDEREDMPTYSLDDEEFKEFVSSKLGEDEEEIENFLNFINPSDQVLYSSLSYITFSTLESFQEKQENENSE